MPPAQGVDYESKGLSQVKLDAVTSLSSDSELSGSAWLDPTDAFPVDRWAADDLEFPRRVRFRAVSGRNKEAIRLFRRNQLLFPLVSSRSHDDLKARSSSSSSEHPISRNAAVSRPPGYQTEIATSASTCSSASSNQPQRRPAARLASPFPDRIIGWWEDSWGAWIISDDTGRVISFNDYWQEVVTREGAQTDDDVPAATTTPTTTAGGGGDEAERLKLGVRRYGGLAMDILIQTAEVLDNLHDMHLALGICPPTSLQVKFKPPVEPGEPSVDLSYKAIHEWEPKIEVIDLSAAILLDGLAMPNGETLSSAPNEIDRRRIGLRKSFSSSEREGSPLRRQTDQSGFLTPGGFERDFPTSPSSSIFLPNQISDQSADLNSEYFIKNHLRWIAPEALGQTADETRNAPVGDVYSFGVLAYELITGCPVEPIHDEVDLLSDIHRHINHSIVPASQVVASQNLPYLLPPRLSEILSFCLEKAPDARYSSFKALMHDLRTFQSLSISQASDDMALFSVGEADRASRFALPSGLVAREDQMDVLTTAFKQAILPDQPLPSTSASSKEDARKSTAPLEPNTTTTTPNSSTAIHPATETKGGLGVVTVWGASGSGKSELMKTWSRWIKTKSGVAPLVGWAKLDQHMKKPLNGFTQIFCSLLDQVFSDPKEDVSVWREKIMQALASQASIFLGLIGPEWRDALTLDWKEEVLAVEMDWDLFIGSTRTWLKKILQTFATAERPLVICLDDIQWLADELPFWQTLLASTLNRLEHVFIVAGYRTETTPGDDDIRPSDESLLCPSIMIHVPRLARPAIAKYLQGCFHWGDADPKYAYLSTFLASQTSGSPLYLASLVCQLVRDRIITFNWKQMRWTFNIDELPRHTTGIDGFLESVMRGFEEGTQELLRILACLRSSGIKLEYLSSLGHHSVSDARVALYSASTAGVVSISADSNVRFTHDKQRVAATALIPPERKASIHYHIAQFTLESGLSDEYLFDTADCFITARSLGHPIEDEKALAVLVLKAAERANRAAAFRLSLAYLRCADELANLTRECSLPFAQLWAEVCAVEQLPDLGLEKIQEMATYVQAKPKGPVTFTLLVEFRILLVRLLISNGRLAEAVHWTIQTVDEVGYTEEVRAKLVQESIPASQEDIEKIRLESDCMRFQSKEDQALAIQLCRILSYVGPTMYVSLPGNGQIFLELGVALCTRLGDLPLPQRADYTAYLLAVWAITAVPKLKVRQAAVTFALDVINLQRGSYFENAAVICCVAQLHLWTDLQLLRADYTYAYETSVSSSNWDAGAYVVGLSFLTILFSNESLSDYPAMIASQYSAVEQIAPPGRVFVKAPLQAYENLADDSRPFEELRKLNGDFIDVLRDQALVNDIPMYSLEFRLLQLLLATSFVAPWSEMEPILAAGDEVYSAFTGVVLMPLWLSLSAFYLVTEGTEDQQVDAERRIKELEPFALTSDFAAQLRVLRTVQRMRKVTHHDERWSTCMAEVEDCRELLQEGNFAFLSAMVAFKWARILASCKNGDSTSPLVFGYASAAHHEFSKAKTPALARLVRQYFPHAGKLSSSVPTTLPSQVLAGYLETPTVHKSPPPLEHAESSSTLSTTADDESTASNATMDDSLTKMEHLDSLTFIRASLVLAQSGDQIAVKLMRILLQFTRASYGALALVSTASEPSSASLKLRACGSYENLRSFDIDLSSATALCPTSTILHVYRTNKPLTNAASLEKRQDPYFALWQPRSILVLPLVLQGQCRGVVLLLSKSFSSSPLPAASIEMVSSLATFAGIAIESVEHRSDLEQQVASRTAALESALQSTSSFLSHMSHELRTPLHSVLGLLSVLEDSTNLTTSERESLVTIRNSGEDLQTVISNVLDISKIQSGGVVVEAIPLDLRALIEVSLESIAVTAAQKGIEVVYSVGVADDIPCGLLSDSYRVKQILLNLLSNACKFVPSDSAGVVEVHSSAEPVGDDQLRLTVSVKDTGPGITPAGMDKLFKTFSQVDSGTTRQHGGSGLGLAIAKSLANLLKGDAWAESTFGEGSTFFFSFVAQKSPHNALPTRPAHAVPKSSFIISRGCQMRSTLEKNLVAYRIFPCRTATTFEEATASTNPEALTSNTYDFIFIDAFLVTNLELLEIKRLQPRAKVILLTTALDRSGVIKNFSIDPSHTLVRPIRASNLYDLVRPSTTVEPAVATGVATVNKSGKKFDNTLAESCPLRILLVDDNRVNTVVGRKMLERFGYRDIDICFDGQQAVDAAESRVYDLIFLDLQMPVCDGITANQRIQRSPLVGAPPPLVTALTANTDKGTRDLVVDEGFFAFLSKPLNVTALHNVLTQSYATVCESRSRRRSSSTIEALDVQTPPVLPGRSSPPSMLYLDVYLAGC